MTLHTDHSISVDSAAGHFRCSCGAERRFPPLIEDALAALSEFAVHARDSETTTMTDPIAASDAPSLVSMLAEMRLAAVDYDERCRRGGDSAKAEELLRLLRVAARCLRCGTCHALATVATKEPRYPDGPMGGYPYCDACGEPGRHADLPQAADVRRIAELLGEASDG